MSAIIISARTASEEVFVTRRGVKRKNCATTYYAIPGFDAVLKITVVSIIKIVTFNMNPKFTEVTLNSFIFARDIFMQILQENLGKEILHMYEISSCLLHSVIL